MRYLFFDIEKATHLKHIKQICEFGYIITNELFQIIDRNNLIINPNISHKEWNWYTLKYILTRERDEYEKSQDFSFYYEQIRKIISNADYIFGHTIDEDAEAINHDCKLSKLPSIDYKFYDIKILHKNYYQKPNPYRLVDILKELEVIGNNKEHDAECDALNTMFALKAILEKERITVEELCQKCPQARKESYKFVVKNYK